MHFKIDRMDQVAHLLLLVLAMARYAKPSDVLGILLIVFVDLRPIQGDDGPLLCQRAAHHVQGVAD